MRSRAKALMLSTPVTSKLSKRVTVTPPAMRKESVSGYFRFMLVEKAL